ncbi:hypothetical protein HB815_00965 [Listeria booriae]|uniref:hypothetical protein n=1 Tax=Listeria booriae TaxID=1552123 RepID=UPI001626F10B|nr:hypothetical protein [Listeria booriae]MBC1209486.1 hypothetical protein [Listeria booriae]
MTPDDVVSIIKATSNNGISFWQAVLAAAIPGGITIFITLYQLRKNQQKEVNLSKKEARYFYYYVEKIIIQSEKWRSLQETFNNVEEQGALQEIDVVWYSNEVQKELDRTEEDIMQTIGKLNLLSIDNMEYRMFSLALKAKEYCDEPFPHMTNRLKQLKAINHEIEKYTK